MERGAIDDEGAAYIVDYVVFTTVDHREKTAIDLLIVENVHAMAIGQGTHPEAYLRAVGEAGHSGIGERAILAEKSKPSENVLGIGIFEGDSAYLDAALYVFAKCLFIDIFDSFPRAPTVPWVLCCGAVNHHLPEFRRAHGAVFIGTPDAVASIAGVGLSAARKLNFDIGLAILCHELLDPGMNLRLYMVSDCLAYGSERLLAGLLSNDLSVISNAEIESPVAVFVENGGNGLHAFPHLASAFLVFDSLSLHAGVHMLPLSRKVLPYQGNYSSC